MRKRCFRLRAHDDDDDAIELIGPGREQTRCSIVRDAARSSSATGALGVRR
jgi:hypothetical protein